MYQIIKRDGSTVGCTEQPRYIRRAENGCYVEAERQNAVGIAFEGTVYNLFGHSEIQGAPEVLLTERDAGPAILSSELTGSDHDEAIAELTERIANLEIGG